MGQQPFCKFYNASCHEFFTSISLWLSLSSHADLTAKVFLTHNQPQNHPLPFTKRSCNWCNISIPKYSLTILDYDPVKLSTKCSLPTFYVYPYGPESSSGPCVCDRPSWHQISEGMLQLFFGQHQLSCQFVLFQYEACSSQVSWSS